MQSPIVLEKNSQYPYVCITDPPFRREWKNECHLMSKHRRKSNTRCLNHFQTSHSRFMSENGKKRCKLLAKLWLTIKTAMKDVQQQHFYSTQQLKWLKWLEMFQNPCYLCFCLLVCLFFSRLSDEPRSKTFANYPYFSPATTTSIYSLKRFTFHLQREN